MRKWIRERAKRRKKPSENLSEATGKVGQALDPSQPAPIVPSYGPVDDDDVEPSAEEPVATSQTAEPRQSRRIEVETQPESPNAPPASPDAATRRPAQPQG